MERTVWGKDDIAKYPDHAIERGSHPVGTVEAAVATLAH